MVARRGVGGWGLRSWGVWGFDGIIILSIPATLLYKGANWGGFFGLVRSITCTCALLKL